MKVAVLQQFAPHAYGDSRGKELTELKGIASKCVDRCLEVVAEAAEKGADLAVTVETVNGFLSLGDTRFTYDETLESETVRRFSEAAKKHKMHIVAGLALNIDGTPYNCAVLFNSEGEIVGVHKKVHLPAGEELHYAHGDRFEVFETEFGRPLSNREMEKLSDWNKVTDKKLILYALREASAYQALNMNYIDKILKDWKDSGLTAQMIEEGKR
jgi:DnaD/phage-associated family protein